MDTIKAAIRAVVEHVVTFFRYTFREAERARKFWAAMVGVLTAAIQAFDLVEFSPWLNFVILVGVAIGVYEIPNVQPTPDRLPPDPDVLPHK